VRRSARSFFRSKDLTLSSSMLVPHGSNGRVLENKFRTSSRPAHSSGPSRESGGSENCRPLSLADTEIVVTSMRDTEIEANASANSVRHFHDPR